MYRVSGAPCASSSAGSPASPTPSWRSRWARGRSGWCFWQRLAARGRPGRRGRDRRRGQAPRRDRRRVRQPGARGGDAASPTRAGLTIVQLHGQEGPVFCGEVARRTGCKVIKAARVRSRADIQALRASTPTSTCSTAMSPGTPGGTGETFAWDLARGTRLEGAADPQRRADARERRRGDRRRAAVRGRRRQRRRGRARNQGRRAAAALRARR